MEQKPIRGTDGWGEGQSRVQRLLLPPLGPEGQEPLRFSIGNFDVTAIITANTLGASFDPPASRLRNAAQYLPRYM